MDAYNKSNLKKKRIVYPVYQTTNRYRNLYSDIRIWVRELIQNADDAGAKTISFDIKLPDYINVKNDGHPFSKDDVERLLNPAKGGKALEKTGTMNLGALSVLSITDEPWYHSGNILLKFEMDHETEDFTPFIDEDYSNFYNGTKIKLSLHSRLTKDDLHKLEKVDEFLTRYPHLLFTENLERIDLYYSNKEISVKREEELKSKEEEGRLHVEISNVKISHEIREGRNKIKNIQEWFIASSHISIPRKYFSKKELKEIKSDINLPIYIAILYEGGYPKRVNLPIYIVFPSDTQLGLGFVICSNFKPDTSRKGFASEGIEGSFNRYLLRKISHLLESALNHIIKGKSDAEYQEKRNFFRSLLEILKYNNTNTNLEPYIKKYINEPIISFLKNHILDNGGNWVSNSQIFLSDPMLWEFFEEETHFIQPFEDEEINSFIKELGVREKSTKDVVNLVTHHDFRDKERLLKAWSFLIDHRETINSKEIARYLLDGLASKNSLNGSILDEKYLLILDKIYSYLGKAENFESLPIKIRNRLKKEPIIYIPEIRQFKRPTNVMIYSKEAQKIFGNSINYIQHRKYPNSLTFFKRIGLQISIKTDNIADFLIEYIHSGDIDSKQLFLLYKILGQRYKYLSKKKQLLLRNSSIIPNKNLTEFKKPSEIYIPDDKTYENQFPSIPIVHLNNRIIKFLEKVGVKRISTAVSKQVLFSGVISKNDYSRVLTHRIKELVPYIDIVIKESHLIIDESWKQRIYQSQCVICDELVYELRYKSKKKRVPGGSVEYSRNKKQFGIQKDSYKINTQKFEIELARRISELIFEKDLAKAKLISPIIEKLLTSENRIHTLDILGYSTFSLETKGLNSVKKHISLPKMAERPQELRLEEDKIYDYYQLDRATEEFIQNQRKKLFKTLEFSGRVLDGGVDIRNPIPALSLKKDNEFHYYVENEGESSVPLKKMKSFFAVLQKIIHCMDGRSETVSIAYFKNAIHAFNINGQLIFNYFMLVNEKLEEEIPLYFIWIMIAAHELAHNVSKIHNQLHSKYVMLFSIKALKRLKEIKKEYQKYFT